MQAETEPCFLMEARLESYIAAALAAEQCRQRGKRLSVYSFGLCGENSCFTPKTAFSGVLEADVQKIACSREELAALLYDAVPVQDLPGTAEADAANLYYFQQIHSQVALCDVCAVQVLNGKTEPQQIFPSRLRKRAGAAFKTGTCRRTVPCELYAGNADRRACGQPGNDAWQIALGIWQKPCGGLIGVRRQAV